MKSNKYPKAEQNKVSKKIKEDKDVEKTFFQKYLPYIITISVIIFINFLYFWPSLSGKTIYQGDIVSHKGMSHEAAEYSKATGDVALWTNAMFSGMPTYQIMAPQKHNFLKYITNTLKLGFSKPIGYFIFRNVEFLFNDADYWF
ncbi:MAG: hypothetical protein R2771_03200 [Saprospiraceae bacterium]